MTLTLVGKVPGCALVASAVGATFAFPLLDVRLPTAEGAATLAGGFEQR